MVWCGIVNGYLIGPSFFDGNVDRHTYSELLRDHLPGLLENVDLAVRQRMWLKQDGFFLFRFFNNSGSKGYHFITL